MKNISLSVISIFCFVASNAAIINIPADYGSIQQGINNANNSDTVLVQPGIYIENLNFNGKNIVVASLYLTTGDTTYIASTIISSPNPIGPDKSVVTFQSNETSSAQLTGLTLKDGNGNFRRLGFDYVYYGGGVYCNNASPVLSHLIIIDCNTECGGGIFLYNSNSIVEYCQISDNICNSMAPAAPNAGGGIVLWNCQDAIIRNNIIRNNYANRAGGAIYSLTSKALVVNCLIANNHSSIMGSAFYADSWTNMEITNSTICGNICDPEIGLRLSGVMYCLDSAKINIGNSIFYHNQPAAAVCQFNYSQNEFTVSHSDIEGGADSIITNNGGNNVIVNWLSGNLDLDPQFVNVGFSDFHLQFNSPCINAGDTTGVVGIPLTDLDSNNRFNGIIDMGCYEYQGSTGITAIQKQQLVYIYPNPASDYLILEMAEMASEVTVVLYDLRGASLFSEKCPVGQNTIQIPVSEFANGIYFLRFSDKQSIGAKKVVVAH